MPTQINALPVDPADLASQLVHCRAERNPTRRKSRQIFGPTPLGGRPFQSSKSSVVSLDCEMVGRICLMNRSQRRGPAGSPFAVNATY